MVSVIGWQCQWMCVQIYLISVAKFRQLNSVPLVKLRYDALILNIARIFAIAVYSFEGGFLEIAIKFY